MTSKIESPSKGNLRAIIEILAAEGRQPVEIYTIPKIVCGDYNNLGPGRVPKKGVSIRQLETALKNKRIIKVKKLPQCRSYSFHYIQFWLP